MPLLAYNIDRTLNKKGKITCFIKTEVDFGDHKKLVKFYISGIGKQQVILDYLWLRESSPIINWTKRSIT